MILTVLASNVNLITRTVQYTYLCIGLKQIPSASEIDLIKASV